MKRTNLSSILLLTIWFGGCAPAPKPVAIDFDRIPVNQSDHSAVVSGPGVAQKSLKLSGSVGGRGARVLEEKEGIALWNQAREILSENREKSLQRLRRDLERKYLGESRSKAIEAAQANEAVDDAAWQNALDQAKDLMDRYAGEKTELSADLAGRIGFPDEGQSLPRRRKEEVYAELRAKKVEELRKDLEALDSQFAAELNAIITAYQKDRQNRIVALLELDYAGDVDAVARADEEARAAIRRVIGRVDAAIPQLQKRLEALDAKTVTGKSAEAVQPQFEDQTWTEGLSQADIKKYANVFVKSRGYALDTSPQAVDVTEEFKEWLKKNAVSR